MNKADIILLTYNSEKFIGRTLDSILKNNCKSYKIIISDDSSKDTTVEIIRKYQLEHNGLIDFYQNETNIGVTANANRALMRSAADIVMFCGHDDLFYPDKIKRCISEFANNPGVSLVYHDCDVIVDNRIVMRYSDTHAPQEGNASKYLLHGCFSTATSVCVNGDLAREIKFNEKIHNTSDYLFFYEVGKRGGIKYVPEILGAYVRHGSNLTSDLQNKEDFDSVKVGLHILENYKEDRLAAIVNINWVLFKIFSKNKIHILFYLFSPLLSLVWIVGRKFGKKRIRLKSD